MRTLLLAILATSPALADTFKDRPPADVAKYLADVMPASKRGYVEQSDGLYAASTHSSFGKELGGNSISYTIEGDAKRVKSFQLTFAIYNANGERDRAQSIRLYRKLAGLLVERATGAKVADEVLDVKEGGKAKQTANGCTVDVTYEGWETGKGYTITLTIR